MWKFIYSSESKYFQNLFIPNIIYIFSIFIILPFFIQVVLKKQFDMNKNTFPLWESLSVCVIFFLVCRFAFYYISWKKFKVLALKASKSNSIAFYFHMQYEYVREGIIKRILCFIVGIFVIDFCFFFMPMLMNKTANSLIVFAIPLVLIYTIFGLTETIRLVFLEVRSLYQLKKIIPETINLQGSALFLYQGVSSDSEIYKKEKQQLEKLFEEVRTNTIKGEKRGLEKSVVQNLPKQAKKRL